MNDSRSRVELWESVKLALENESLRTGLSKTQLVNIILVYYLHIYENPKIDKKLEKE